MKLDHLLNALKCLIKERQIIMPSALSPHEHDELTNLIAEILDMAFQTVEMKKIEEKINHAMKIDINTLEKGLNIIKKANPKKHIH